MDVFVFTIFLQNDQVFGVEITIKMVLKHEREEKYRLRPLVKAGVSLGQSSHEMDTIDAERKQIQNRIGAGQFLKYSRRIYVPQRDALVGFLMSSYH